MDANRRRILELAEQGDWDNVLELIEHDAALAKAQDDFGMLPLHWACTEPTVPLDVIKALLAAFPQACQLENLSGMAPLHVAIASKMTGLAIHALLQTYPEVAFMKDGSGRYPVELAMDNNLPKYTIDLIRKAGARAVQSSSTLMQRSASFDDVSSMSNSSRWSSDPASDNNHDDENSKAELLKAQSLGSLMASRQASEYARLLDEKKLSRSTSTASSTGSTASGGAPIGPIESTEISLHLKELLAQLQQLSVDIRTSSSASDSTYRSSLSSSSSGSRRNSPKSNSPSVNTVLWNPSDKLGFVMEPVRNDTGARIKKFGSRSSVLGAESLSEGDVLISINGTSVTNSSFATITRFLKHSKVTCKLCFSKGSSSLSDFVSSSSNRSTKSSVLTTNFTAKTRDYRANSSTSSIGNESTNNNNNNNNLTSQTADESALLYAKVAELLDTTLKKVAAVEETVRLSSAMSFCA